MGKSYLMIHYIRQCRKQWPNATQRTEFQQSICAAHTIRLEVSRSIFVNGPSLAGTMNEVLAEEIRASLVPGTEPALLTTPQSTEDFMRGLVDAVGPLFIILDDFGRGFMPEQHEDERASCELFRRFCKIVLQEWVNMRGMYFVLTGQASFLRFIDLKLPHLWMMVSSWNLHRLPLSVLRPDHIKAILTNTRVLATESTTLDERWGLKNDDNFLMSTSHGAITCIRLILHQWGSESDHPGCGVVGFKPFDRLSD